MFTANGKREIQGEKFSSKRKTWSGVKNSHLLINVNAMLNPSKELMKHFFYSSVERELFKKICYSFQEKE